MTDTAHAATTARPLYRDPHDAKLAGVCAAFARYTDTDPVIWRIATAVLTVFGGAGAVLYLIGWLLVPKLGADTSIVDRWVRRPDRSLSPPAMAVLAIGAVVLLGFGDGRAAVAVGVLAVVGYLVYRERQGNPLAPSYAGPVMGPAPYDEPPPPAAPRPRREPSRLGGLTLSFTAVVSGVLVLARVYGAEHLTPARILAVAVIVIGAGLVVGARYGRARWLMGVGLALCLAMAGTAAADAGGASLRGGVGHRTWQTQASLPDQGYRLGLGDATLDLRSLPVQGPHQVVRAHVAVGHLLVLVPDSVRLRVHASVRAGAIVVDGQGLGSDRNGVDRTRTFGPPGDPRVEVEATAGTGQVEVRHG